MLLLDISPRRPMQPRWRTWSLSFVAALVPSLASGQQIQRSDGFINFRYASHTSLSLYGGYDIGGTLLLIGMVQNPRTEYREIVGGAARSIGRGKVSATVVLAGASASDGWYGQLYVLPELRLGPVAISALLLAYQPLEAKGARQFYVNPMSAVIPLAGRVQLGVSYALTTQSGTASRQSIGPVLKLPMNGWTATFTAFAGLRRATSEFRIDIDARL